MGLSPVPSPGPVKGAKKTPGSGRKKGTPNKKTAYIMDKLSYFKCDPMERLIKLGQQAEQEGDISLASNIYKDICQYVYPKRRATEMQLTGADGGPVKTVTQIVFNPVSNEDSD